MAEADADPQHAQLDEIVGNTGGAITGEAYDALARRLSQRKISRILQLADDGLTHAAIGQDVRCHEVTVGRVLVKWADMRPLARRLLESRADKLARTVINTKDAGVALKALAKLDVVREDAAPNGPQVVVVLGSSLDPLAVKARQVSPLIEAQAPPPE